MRRRLARFDGQPGSTPVATGLGLLGAGALLLVALVVAGTLGNTPPALFFIPGAMMAVGLLLLVLGVARNSR